MGILLDPRLSPHRLSWLYLWAETSTVFANNCERNRGTAKRRSAYLKFNTSHYCAWKLPRSCQRVVPGDSRCGNCRRWRQTKSFGRVCQYSVQSANVVPECGQVHHFVAQTTHFQLYVDSVVGRTKFNFIDASVAAEKHAKKIQMRAFYLGKPKLLAQDENWHEFPQRFSFW